MELYAPTRTAPRIAAPPAPARGPAADVAAATEAPARPRLASLERVREAERLTRATFVLADTLAFAAVLALTWATAALAGWAWAPRAGLTLAALLTGVYALTGAYRRTAMHPATELRRLTLATAVTAAASAAGLALLGPDPASALPLALAGAYATVLLPAGRLFSRLLWARTGWWGTPVAVIASGPCGGGLIEAFRRWPELGLRPVALLQNGTEVDVADGIGYFGRTSKAPWLAQTYGVAHALVALPELSPEKHAETLRRFTQSFREVLVVGAEACGRSVWTALPSPEGLVGYLVRDAVTDRSYQLAKRAADVAGALVGLTLAAPLFVLLAVLIRLDSRGDVFFRQPRMGRGGALFSALKFRTMHGDAERRLAELLELDPALREEYKAYHKLTDDPRVTRVGRWLRRTSLDELPQLLNVLRGEMSLVGPRAYLPREIHDMKGLERVVLQSRPGLTGLWQVSGSNGLPFATRVDLDVHYVQNATPWLDLYILARTVPVVCTAEGAS